MKLRFSIRDLLWLTVAVALCAGWWLDRARVARQRDEAKLELWIRTGYAGQTSNPIRGEPMLIVLGRVYEGGWKTDGTIIVQADGSFEATWEANRSSPAVQRGALPEKLTGLLQTEIATGDSFKKVGRTALYEYGIDDSKIQHPSGIRQLLDLTAEKH